MERLTPFPQGDLRAALDSGIVPSDWQCDPCALACKCGLLCGFPLARRSLPILRHWAVSNPETHLRIILERLKGDQPFEIIRSAVCSEFGAAVVCSFPLSSKS